MVVLEQNQSVTRLTVLEQVGSCDCMLALNPAECSDVRLQHQISLQGTRHHYLQNANMTRLRQRLLRELLLTI